MESCYSKLTQAQMFYRAQANAARANETFLEMVPTMTRGQLAKLIELRPALWGRFSAWLEVLPETREATDGQV